MILCVACGSVPEARKWDSGSSCGCNAFGCSWDADLGSLRFNWVFRPRSPLTLWKTASECVLADTGIVMHDVDPGFSDVLKESLRSARDAASIASVLES